MVGCGGSPCLQAVTTAALLAQSYSGRVTVLVIDEPGTTPVEPEKQIESITW
jgi:Set1/Ash2 histone methyltransferase complex subunit ASH2